MKKPEVTKIEFTKEILDEVGKIKRGEPVPKTKIITNKEGHSYEYTPTKDFPMKLEEKD